LDRRKKKGNLFVVSAPSGAGKTTLCRKICETMPGVKHSVSYTTRLPRPGEIADIHYTFVDEEEFRSMIASGEFVEWAEVHGNFYGTSKKRIEKIINEGQDVILDIDVQGAKQIKEYFTDSVLVFVLPPSMEELEKRLFDRMSDSKEVIEKRLKRAREEIQEYKNYDYVIVNNTLDKALNELASIIVAENVKISKFDGKWIRENFLKEE
jgi:guanylate kinase